jgi:hypothetical protein
VMRRPAVPTHPCGGDGVASFRQITTTTMWPWPTRQYRPLSGLRHLAVRHAALHGLRHARPYPTPTDRPAGCHQRRRVAAQRYSNRRLRPNRQRNRHHPAGNVPSGRDRHDGTHVHHPLQRSDRRIRSTWSPTRKATGTSSANPATSRQGDCVAKQRHHKSLTPAAIRSSPRLDIVVSDC